MTGEPAPSRDFSRRGFAKLALGAGVGGGLALAAYSRYQVLPRTVAEATAAKPAPIDEHDEKNIKLAHRVSSGIADDDILFLKQLGLRWMRVELRPEEAQLEALAKVQKRFEQAGIKIFSAMHPAYRSLKIQLGAKGRDEDIDTYRTFLKSCGKLGIPLANYDFHPGNTYTTATVERRGYLAREFKLDDFREKIEKQRFDREYSARRDLGLLSLLRQGGAAGRRGGRRQARPAPRRPAARQDERRRQALRPP